MSGRCSISSARDESEKLVPGWARASRVNGLVAIGWGFAAAGVVHGLAMEFGALRARSFAGSRQGAVIAFANIQRVIDVAVEMVGAVIPRAGADEDAVGEPFGSIIAVGRAGVRRRFIVAVGANRSRSDGDAEVGRPAGNGESRQDDGHCD